MSRYTEKPMARAAEHLASARYAEAAGAFRAVLRIDPSEFQAHFGLADALVARGQRTEAVDGLVGAAEACSGQEDHAAALTLYGKALSIEPGRLELHLDVAMAEAALGRMDAAQSRLENLAEVYMQAGRTDEAAEVYRCLAGWEDDGEEEGEEPEEIAAATAAPPARVTYVPTAPAESAPSHGVPSHAVPQMVTSNETVVISTILVTPDGQLMQMPIEQQYGQPRPLKTGDTVPPIPAELLEAAHSAPIDLAAGEELADADRTVVAFPPPPPKLPEEYESAAHPIDRSELEAAVVAAMDNLAQLEEEDMTLVMQRLPPQPRVQSPRTRTGETRLPGFLIKSKPAPAPAPAPAPEPEEPVAEGKLRLRPAPRPAAAKAAPAKAAAPTPRAGVAKSVSKGVAPGPARAAGAAKAPVGASRPAPTGRAGGAKPAASPTRTGAAQKPAARAAGASPAASSARASAGAKAGQAPPSRAGAPPRASAESRAKPTASPAPEASAPKATRPNNPLADRLRRRAGLPRPDAAAPGRPTQPRATEPITIRRGNPPKK